MTSFHINWYIVCLKELFEEIKHDLITWFSIDFWWIIEDNCVLRCVHVFIQYPLFQIHNVIFQVSDFFLIRFSKLFFVSRPERRKSFYSMVFFRAANSFLKSLQKLTQVQGVLTVTYDIQIVFNKLWLQYKLDIEQNKRLFVFDQKWKKFCIDLNRLRNFELNLHRQWTNIDKMDSNGKHLVKKRTIWKENFAFTLLTLWPKTRNFSPDARQLNLSRPYTRLYVYLI